MSIAKATAAAITYKGKDGREWRATPPPFRVFGEFEAWSESETLAVAAKALGSAEACRVSLKGGEAMNAMLRTARGTAWLCWRVLMENHEGLTLEDVGDLDPDDRSEIVNRAIAAALPDRAKAVPGKPGDPFPS